MIFQFKKLFFYFLANFKLTKKNLYYTINNIINLLEEIMDLNELKSVIDNSELSISETKDDIMFLKCLFSCTSCSSECSNNCTSTSCSTCSDGRCSRGCSSECLAGWSRGNCNSGCTTICVRNGTIGVDVGIAQR